MRQLEPPPLYHARLHCLLPGGREIKLRRHGGSDLAVRIGGTLARAPHHHLTTAHPKQALPQNSLTREIPLGPPQVLTSRKSWVARKWGQKLIIESKVTDQGAIVSTNLIARLLDQVWVPGSNNKVRLAPRHLARAPALGSSMMLPVPPTSCIWLAGVAMHQQNAELVLIDRRGPGKPSSLSPPSRQTSPASLLPPPPFTPHPRHSATPPPALSSSPNPAPLADSLSPDLSFRPSIHSTPTPTPSPPPLFLVSPLATPSPSPQPPPSTHHAATHLPLTPSPLSRVLVRTRCGKVETIYDGRTLTVGSKPVVVPKAGWEVGSRLLLCQLLSTTPHALAART